MDLHKYLVITSAAALTACGTLYVPPATGPRADLRIIAKNSEGYYAWTRDVTDTCSRDSPNLPVIGGDRGADSENLGMPEYLGPRGDRFERKIVADKPVAITASSLYRVGWGEALMSQSVGGQAQYQENAWSCAVKIEFMPVAGEQYELVYDFAKGKCDVRARSHSPADGPATWKPMDVKTSPATCGTAMKGS